MDDGKPPLISLLILLIFSFYLALVETALASVSKNKLKLGSERGDNRAKKALKALEDFDNAITTILICNNIVSVTIASIVTVWVTRRWGVTFVSISTIITTIVIFFACEMLPKSFAKKYSYPSMLSCATLLCLLMAIFKPFAKLLTKIGENVAKHSNTKQETSVTEDEIADIIEDMTEEGTLDEDQSELISSALQFGDVKVESIITPLNDIIALDISKTNEEVLAFIREQTHSRIPVYDDSLENIVGILQTRKYMRKYMESSKAPKVSSLMDKVYFVKSNTDIQKLLPIMSKKKINIAIVTDDDKEPIGLVTVEDILEELVGDIWDEKDNPKEKEDNK